MKFSRQEYWNGLPFSPPGDLANPGPEPTSLASPALTGGFFTTSTTWKAQAHNKLLLLFFPKQSRFMEWDCFLKTLCTYGGPMGQSLKGMETHSSVLAWRIPGMGEPGGLPSMGSHRVGHDWSNLAAAATWANLQTHHWNSRSELSACSHDLEVLYWVELRLERLPGKRNTCVFQIICSWQRGLKLTERHFAWSRQFSRFSYRMLRAADTFVSTGVRHLGMDVWDFFFFFQLIQRKSDCFALVPNNRQSSCGLTPGLLGGNVFSSWGGGRF